MKNSVALLLTMVVAHTACAPRYVIDVDPASTAEMVVLHVSTARFSLGEPSRLTYVVVFDCDTDQTMWAVSNEACATPNAIVYGATPPGWSESQRPLPLEPGCYRIEYNFFTRGFLVKQDGSVVELSPAEVREYSGGGGGRGGSGGEGRG